MEQSFQSLQQIQKLPEFYALNNRGIFCSTDLGISWEEMTDNNGIEWPKEYLSQHPKAFAVDAGA